MSPETMAESFWTSSRPFTVGRFSGSISSGFSCCADCWLRLLKFAVRRVFRRVRIGLHELERHRLLLFGRIVGQLEVELLPIGRGDGLEVRMRARQALDR